MKTTILAFTFLIVQSLSAQQVKKEFYETGQLKATGPVTENYRHGFWKEYHLNGQVKSEGTYSYNHQTGIWKEYYDNGKISSVGEYAGNEYSYVRKGNWKFYYRNGQLQAEGGYLISTEKIGSQVTRPECITAGNWKCFKENGEADLLANSVLNCANFIKNKFQDICHGVYNTKPLDNDTSFRVFRASLEYQKNMYEISCANPKTDTREQAYERVRIFWKYFGPNLRCYGYPTSIATGKNFFKFAMDNNLSATIREAVRFWKVDLNFIDTNDGKTLLDFIKTRMEYFKNDRPPNELSANMYQKIYDYLRENGAKHAHEL